MGFYINPANESKEEFLKREALSSPFDVKIAWGSVPDGFLPVVLVNNGPFTAAAIAYCERELDELTSLEDTRPRKIFLIKTEKLLSVTGRGFEEYARSNGLV